MFGKWLIRAGLAGIVIWALIQGGYALYKNQQEKAVQKYFQEAIESANAREFSQAFEALKKIQNMPESSDEQKATAKLLEQTLELLQKAPDNQKILDDMNAVMEKSNILQNQLLENARKTAHSRYSKNLESQRDVILQKLQRLNQQDVSKLSNSKRRNLEQEKFQTLQELEKTLTRMNQQATYETPSSKPSALEEERDIIQELSNLNKIQESLLPKSEISDYRAHKQMLVKRLKNLQKTPELQNTLNSSKKRQLLKQLTQLMSQYDRARSQPKKESLRRRMEYILKEFSQLSPQTLPTPQNYPLLKNGKAPSPKTNDTLPATTPKQSSKSENQENNSQALKQNSLSSLPEKKNAPPLQDKQAEEATALEKKNQELQRKQLENLAKENLAQEKYAQALPLYQQLEALQPNNPQYLGMEALTQLHLNQVPTAKGKLQQLQEKFQGDPMIPLLSAELALKEHSSISTEPLYQQVIQQREMGLALYRLGNAALKRGQASQALAFYQRAQKAPDYATLGSTLQTNLLHNQGEALIFLSRTQEAKQSFQSALKKNPQYAPSHIALAQILYKEQNYSAASNELEQATGEDPKNFFAWTLLGNVYHKAGKPEKAKESFLKALSLQPNNAMLLYNLGTEEITLQDYPAAISHLQNSLSLKPSDKTKIQLGIALVRSGKDFPAARQIFTEVLKSHPDDPSANLGLVEILDTQGHYSEALSKTQEILNKSPNNQEVLYKKATLLFKLNQYPQSVETFRTLLKLDASAENRIGLAHALVSAGNAQEALKEYETLLSQNKTPELLEDRANALIQLKRLSEAKITLEEILRDYKNTPSLPRIRQKLATINRLLPNSQ